MGVNSEETLVRATTARQEGSKAPRSMLDDDGRAAMAWRAHRIKMLQNGYYSPILGLCDYLRFN